MNSKCRYHLLVVIFVLTAVAFPNVTFALQDIDVIVGGIAIAKKDPDSEFESTLVSGINVGTTVYVVVKLPDRTVIEFDDSKNELTMKDSNGKSLKVEGSSFGFMANISDDGKTVTLPIRSTGLPSKGTTSLDINGKVKIICGADPKTEEVDVEFVKDKKLKFAGIEFMITEIGDSFMGEENAETIELQCKESPAHIKSILAVLANGREVEISASVSSEVGSGNNVTYGRGYDLPGKAADVKKLKVTFFENVEALEVPLDLNVGLGF